MTSYPKSFDLPQASSPSRSPQARNTQNMAGSVRDPSKTVMNALENPFLPGSDWVYIPHEGKAGPEAPAFDNGAGHAPGGLFETNVEAINALDGGSVLNTHKASGIPTSNASMDGTSNADTAAPCHKPDVEYSHSPKGGSSTAFNVSHMAPWAEKDINKMDPK
ncbi:hypothetical protein ACQKWADRAFT_35143 [Trichoderma austrokoningii]